MAEVSDEATAYSGPRTPCYFATLVALCPTPELLPAERQWIRELHADLQPHAIYAGSYVNVSPEPDLAGIHDVYGSKLARLRAIKTAYDPGNVFHRNANIPPVPPGPPGS
ncbi:MAG: BBE domain-containing protein [Microlunatus sp.]